MSSSNSPPSSPKHKHKDNISKLMESIDNTKSILSSFSEILPKLKKAQQQHHRRTNELIDQLQSVYLPSASMNNPFSNPECPFAVFCHGLLCLHFHMCTSVQNVYIHMHIDIAMGVEMGKFELIEKDYLQKLSDELIAPLKKFKNTQFKNVYSLQSKYKKMIKQHQNDNNDLNGIEHLLKAEIFRFKHNTNVILLNHIDSYWRSFVNSNKTKNNILTRHGRTRLSHLKFTQNFTLNHGTLTLCVLHRLLTDIDENNDESDGDDEHKFEVQFDIDLIDEEVGFNDIKNDMVKFLVKRINKTNQSSTSTKYNRVIYIDSTHAKEKKIKLLSLKQNIREYVLSDIEKVEKSYFNICRLTLKFKDKKEYEFEFETAAKREQCVGHILEYNAYKKSELLSIVISSYNVGESEFNRDNIKNWLKPSTVNGQHHDLYIFGFQEVKSKLKKQWIKEIVSFIDDGSNQYLCLANKFLMGIGIILIIHHSHIAKISHIQSQTVATGKGNIIGNKGAAAISFQFMETTFLFVNCHLAARAERFEKRGKNFARIVKELNIGNIANVDILNQFQHVFWFGDLNYRIEKDFHEVIKLIDDKNWSEIIKYDQLYHAMNFDTVFSGFTEGKIEFCPSYRWERQSNKVSNKRNQPPSYTDRILYRTLPNSLSLWQESYDSFPHCFGSDHRPILSIFRFKPRLPYFAASNVRRKYSEIFISFVELKVKMNDKNVDVGNKMDILFNFMYSDPTQHKLCGGTYDKKTCYFRWPLMALDDLKIEPFVSDPSFLCTTHISLTFVQKSNVLGYGVISLFNAFPSTLVDTDRLKEEYKKENKQMKTMKSVEHRLSTVSKDDIHLLNHKEFKAVISLEGANVGELDGFISVDGKMIRKHIRYATMDAHKKDKNEKFMSPNTKKRKQRLKNLKILHLSASGYNERDDKIRSRSMLSLNQLFGKKNSKKSNFHLNGVMSPPPPPPIKERKKQKEEKGGNK